jgi:hypothetical protein
MDGRGEREREREFPRGRRKKERYIKVGGEPCGIAKVGNSKPILK